MRNTRRRTRRTKVTFATVAVRGRSAGAEVIDRVVLVLLACLLALTLMGCSEWGDQKQSARGKQVKPAEEDVQLASARGGPAQVVGEIEPVAYFHGPMPTGVTVSRQGRMFVNFPKWGDPVDFTVAEVVNGQAVAYPSTDFNKSGGKNPQDALISVQSVVVDPKDRLWILDTGSIQMGPTKPGGPKLVGVDLATNKVFKTITFPADVALPTTYQNDVRFDLRRGAGGMAFITDSSDKGANGIIVVDLESRKSWRRLNDHPSTKADANFVPTVEGEQFMERPAQGQPKPIRIGSDGIAISADGKWLYYCPLASRRLHAVSLDALADPKQSDEQVAATVKEIPGRDFASDGLESDASGAIYLTDYENNAVRRMREPGQFEVIAQDPRMIWPDTLSVASDGYIYFTANQLNRQKKFHQGKDLRQKPYVVFRTKADARPVSLR